MIDPFDDRVAARLRATSGVQGIPSDCLSLFAVPAFLDAADCMRLIAMIDTGRQPSGVLIGQDDPDFRTSESCNLDRADPFVAAIDGRICALMGLRERQGETLQGQRYAPGQRFKPHHDFFHTDQPYWPEQERQGGQRSWTAMLYLNAPDAGGATVFPLAGLAITPLPGMLLAWNNRSADGQPNPATLHEGAPVIAGVKHVVTKWFRDGDWY